MHAGIGLCTGGSSVGNVSVYIFHTADGGISRIGNGISGIGIITAGGQQHYRG